MESSYRMVTSIVAGAIFALMTAHAVADTEAFFVLHQLKKSEIKKIEGVLTCKLPDINDGSACDIRLRVANSDRLFALANAKNARQLFYDGTRAVTIRGKINEAGEIEVSDVQAL